MKSERRERRPLMVALGLAIIGAVGVLLGALVDPETAAFAYLAAVVSALGVSLGALTLLVILTAAKARWFVVLRRTTELIAATLPAIALAFLPILALLPDLYPWARGEDHHAPEVMALLRHRAGWMNPTFFMARAVLYFGVWITVAERFLAVSRAQDRGEAGVLRLRSLAVKAIWPLALTLTFAVMDWIVSLEVRWVSSMAGIRFFASSMLAALAALVATARFADTRNLFRGALRPSHYDALGRLLLTFVIFWSYIAFSELFIVWMADLPVETPFLERRAADLWPTVGVALILGRFLLPFFVLLSRPLKSNPRHLTAVSIWLLVGHYVDTAWLVLPPAPPGAHVFWLEPAALAVVVGLGVAFGAWRASGVPAAPIGDPRLTESAQYARH